MKVADLLKTQEEYNCTFYVLNKDDFDKFDEYKKNFVEIGNDGLLLDCIVYFLCVKDEIVYVGQTNVDPYQRISLHFGRCGEYDKVIFVNVDGNEREGVNYCENLFINLCVPKLNGFLTAFEKSTAPKADTVEEIIEWNKLNNNNRKKVGRPKVKDGEYKTINIAIPVDILQKMEVAKLKYGNNMTTYVNAVIKADLDENYDKYLEIKTIIDNLNKINI